MLPFILYYGFCAYELREIYVGIQAEVKHKP
ncbi:hypothetical protein BH20VER2_BH20VER2_09780 [soil metagenome]